MFQFPRCPPHSLSYGWQCITTAGFPIRKSTGQRLLAPLRSLSRLTASFFGWYRQGIHRTPLKSLLNLHFEIFSILLTCIRYIVVYFVAVHFTCTSPLSQRIISYVLGSTYLEILRDDLTNIYNYLLCSFQRTNDYLYESCLRSLYRSLKTEQC